jgi:thiamine biosynthesis lipoprotein
MRVVLTIFLSFIFLTGYAQERKLFKVKKTLKLMGSPFVITIVTSNEEVGYINIEEVIAEITRIENMISSWNEDSETHQINKNAGVKPVKVSKELFELIERCKQLSELTDGAFDISYASMDKIWRFDGSMNELPNAEKISTSVAKVGYQKIILNNAEKTVYLENKGMKISFGAVGKGFVADIAKGFLIERQVEGGIIDAAGDLSTWGADHKGKKWNVGIVNPLENSKIVSWLPIVESSVATSGNYEKYVSFNGKRYSHIIDPRTGYPSTGILQVSILGKSAEVCDALATAVFIMGKEDGLFLINQLDGVEAIIFDNFNKAHKSDGVLFETGR